MFPIYVYVGRHMIMTFIIDAILLLTYGGDPDMIDYDRLDDYRYEGLYPDEAASRELRRQSPRDGE